MSRIDRMEAELAVLRAEAEFAEKKEGGEVSADDKLALRALREEFRLNHRIVKPGAQPAAIGSEVSL